MITLRRARPMLGTLVDIAVQGDDEARLHRALEKAFAAIAHAHRRMSFHEEGSDVSRLNREACHRPITVTRETWRVLKVAQLVSIRSNGLFDVTVAPALVSRKFLPSLPEMPQPDRCASWRDIDLLPQCGVRFRRPLLIDLGGIAKGFAVDEATAALRWAGINTARINAGGDMYSMGDRREDVYVRNPLRANALLRVGSFREGAIATSGASVGASSLGPHVNPRDGLAAPRFASASIMASRCVVADALTKVLMAGGRASIECLEAFDAAAFVVEWNGQVIATSANHASATHSVKGKR